MRIIDIMYLKDGVPVGEYSKANGARIFEFGGSGRDGWLIIEDNSDRGILPEKDDVQEVSDEEANELFDDEG